MFLMVVAVACLVPLPAWSQQAAVAPRADSSKQEHTLRVVIPNHEGGTAEATITIEQGELSGIPDSDIRVITADSLYLQDSIYASEIHTDVGGVLIVDRDGNYVRLEGLSIEPVRPPDFPHTHDGDRADIIHIFSDVITIEKDEVINGDVVSIFGGHVEVLGRVNGNVASIFGTIDVQGTVEDGAIAPFGTIHIGPRAMVGGDVVASEINKEPGGRIGGLRNELFFKLFGEDWRPGGGAWLRQTFTAVVLMKILFWVFLVLIAHALAARNIAKVKTKIAASFMKSFLMGVLVQILFIPAVLILFVTIIGIPVAIFLLPLLAVAAVVLANAAIGLYIGEKIHENTGIRLTAPLSQTIVGLLALQSIPLLAVVATWFTGLHQVSSIFRIITFALIGLTAVVGYVVVTVGTGAVVTTRFGTRPKDPRPDEASDTEGTTADEADGAIPTPLPHRRSDEPGTAPVT